MQDTVILMKLKLKSCSVYFYFDFCFYYKFLTVSAKMNLNVTVVKHKAQLSLDRQCVVQSENVHFVLWCKNERDRYCYLTFLTIWREKLSRISSFWTGRGF